MRIIITKPVALAGRMDELGDESWRAGSRQASVSKVLIKVLQRKARVNHILQASSSSENERITYVGKS